jgi:hypothetical protein
MVKVAFINRDVRRRHLEYQPTAVYKAVGLDHLLDLEGKNKTTSWSEQEGTDVHIYGRKGRVIWASNSGTTKETSIYCTLVYHA